MFSFSRSTRPFLRKEFVSIEVYYQSCIQVHVILQHRIDIFRYEKVIPEHLLVRLEDHFNAVLLRCGFQRDDPLMVIPCSNSVILI